MPTVKDCHTLTTYYAKLYARKYGEKPVVNRHTARWGFDSVLMDMPLTEAKELLEYYLTTVSPRKHPLDWFFYNYEKLVKGRQDAEEDHARTQRLLLESKKRAEEWRASGHQGIASNKRGIEE